MKKLKSLLMSISAFPVWVYNAIKKLILSFINLLVWIFNTIKNLVLSIIRFIVLFFKTLKNLVLAFFEKLKTPHHSSTNSLRGLYYAIGVFIFTFIILYALVPFKYSSDSEKLKISIIGAAISFVGMLICQFLLPSVLKSFYNEYKWTLGKQIIQSTLMVAVISLGITKFLSDSTINFMEFPIDAFKLLGYSFIPIMAFAFIQESFLKNKFQKNADNLNSELSTKKFSTAENPLKILLFKGTSDKLSLVPNQLIYVKIGPSSSEFYFQNPFGIDKKELTIEAKVVKDELKEHPQFMNFKKNIVVNVLAIQKIEGSARGYDIAIARVNEMIQVSMKYKKNIENL